MKEQRTIKGVTEDEIWQQVEADFKKEGGPLEYYALIEQNNNTTSLDIDIDPGGGFESGYATTIFKALVNIADDFKFAIHEESFLDEVGKFFGMQDVELGYEEFDKKLIVKTNDPEKAKILFSNAAVRRTVQSLKGFTLSLHAHKNDDDTASSKLELTIEDGITDTQKLRQLYNAFYSILNSLQNATAG